MATFRQISTESTSPSYPLKLCLTIQDKDEVELEIKPGVAGLTWIGVKANKEVCQQKDRLCHELSVSINVYPL